MQKPSSDRLVTTHHATYIAPGLMPGYRGHCPGQKFDYGQTYGAFTAKQLQDYRSTVLQSSLTPYSKGGYYATYFSHDPDIVLNNRKTGRERYKDRFQCELYNHDFDRSEEIKRFDLEAQQQREFYKDKTGTIYQPVRFITAKETLTKIKERYMV
ncbi:hypothetical protein D915_005514 [Fasciola hepatica]|uniref:Ciliary microtubule inner protein 2C n=1 Tax=Fasciola hepatica TaxID=6192 RepID=A0A2H1C8A5_FASHE|nr:hypothetical protein D915_005514 [Fasciola hepatica]